MHLDVVIADQDVELAQLYCRFLADHGLSAGAAAGGLECLVMVRERKPQVLVLDHELPWGDGEGVLACLREDGLSLPVILTTWNGSPTIASHLVVLPVMVCLRKFFPLSALLDSILTASNHFRQGGNHYSDRLALPHQGDATWNVNR